jgi:hypothetical protein
VPASASTLPPQPAADGHEAEVISVLLQVCEDLKADELERMALFQAAIVASNLRADHSDDDRIGILAQNAFWGPAAARRDPRIAAEVFLAEARRVRESGGPRSSGRLAAWVQGDSGPLRYRRAGRVAKQLLAAQSSNVIAG